MKKHKPTEKETRLASSQTHLYLEWVTNGLTRTRMNYFSEVEETNKPVELARAKRTLLQGIQYEVKRMVDVLIHETILDRYETDILIDLRKKLEKIQF